MRITKDKAKDVAVKLLEPKKEKWNEVKKELSDYVTEIAKSKVPKPVMDMFKEYPNYVNSKNYSIDIQGEGIDNYDLRHRYISETIPYGDSPIQIDKKQSDKIQKLFTKQEKMYVEMKRLRREIEEAVYNLRTYSKCEKEFPEAYKFLPKKDIPTALSVNLTDIRSKLK